MNDISFTRHLRLFAEAANIDVQDFKCLFVLRIIASFIHIDKIRVTSAVLKCWEGIGEKYGPPGGHARVSATDVAWSPPPPLSPLVFLW
jgi:hypothetical protein